MNNDLSSRIVSPEKLVQNQGAKGLVLAAETAIGSFPVDCVKFMKKCIMIYKKN